MKKMVKPPDEGTILFAKRRHIAVDRKNTLEIGASGRPVLGFG
jgi:hypothetical protein